MRRPDNVYPGACYRCGREVPDDCEDLDDSGFCWDCAAEVKAKDDAWDALVKADDDAFAILSEIVRPLS